MTVEINRKGYAIAKLTIKETRRVREFAARSQAPDLTLEEIDVITEEALEIVLQALRRADGQCALTKDDLESSMTTDDLAAVLVKLIRMSMTNDAPISQPPN